MTTEYERLDPSTWRPRSRFRAAIGSQQQLRTFNDTGGIAVFINVTRTTQPDVVILGSQVRILSFWDTQSRSGFVTKPKFSAGLLTVRFVNRGQISYLRRDGETTASPSIAALTGFDDLLEVRASSGVSALSATIPVRSLVSASEALIGEGQHGCPALEPIADMARGDVERRVLVSVVIRAARLSPDAEDRQFSEADMMVVGTSLIRGSTHGKDPQGV